MHAFRSESYRRVTALMKSVAAVVMVAFLSMVVDPPKAQALPVARVPAPSAGTAASIARAPADRYADSLERLKGLLAKERDRTSRRVGASRADDVERLEAIRANIRDLEANEAASDESFASVAREIESRKLGKGIRDRHLSAEREFRKKQGAMKRILERLKAADASGDSRGREQRVLELDSFLSKNAPGKQHKKLDPSKLPWRVADKSARKPATTTRTFRTFAAPTATTPSLSTAAVGTQAVLPPTAPEYVAETDDAQLTPAVRELAASLGGHPVRIYAWVRNNIEYFPSFGSIQGSDVTLSKRRGNAFDTASLLIALYRASGIPARYVYGTIEVPITAAQNWVGGVATPAAVQQLLGQGGVPNTALVTGGQITHIQLEHVWVEAWVDFVPSRGHVNVQGDTWVPLDASYKQYTETVGLGAQANVTLDAGAIRSAFLTGAVMNEAEGWIQGPNAGAVQSATVTYLTGLNTYVRQSKPGATNGDVFGSRAIVREESEVLAASLPYQTVAVGARYSSLPSGLKHKFRYTVYASELDRALGEPLLTFEEALPRLAGRKVTLFYAPASQGDADVIASCLPKPHADGSSPTAADFAAVRLPAYLIQLRPELRVDGVVRASGAPVTMGTALPATGAFTAMNLTSGWDQTEDLLTAGQATAIGLNLQGIDTRQLNGLKARMEAAKAQIGRSDLTGLTGEQVSGDIVTMAIWSYFAAVDHGGRATRATSGIVDLPALSFGLAHLDVDIAYSFGIARSAQPSGIALDVGHLRHIRWAKDDDESRWVRYNRTMGQHASAMEHQIPEMLFVGPQTPGEAVSAVKLIAKAAAAGQRIYTLTAANLAVALPRLALGNDAMADISAAVAVGKEVTVHERPVAVNGWSGAGYVIVDPQTGAGAYMISGGLSGGKLLAAIDGLLVGLIAGGYMVALVGALLTGGATLGAFLLVAVLIASIVAVISLLIAEFTDAETYKCYAGGAAAGLGIALIFAPLTRVVQVLAAMFGWVFVSSNALNECL